jgi:hypothetical protein
MAWDRKPSTIPALHLVPRSVSAAILLLGLAARAALDPLGDRAVDVVAGDPGLIVVLVGACGRASRLVARKGLRNLDLLGLLGRLDDAGLREQGLDPCLVDKVESSAKQAGEEEVEEDTTTGGLGLVRVKGTGETHIWGSRMLVGASTTLAGPLWAASWKIWPLSLETTAEMSRMTSWGFMSSVNV